VQTGNLDQRVLVSVCFGLLFSGVLEMGSGPAIGWLFVCLCFQCAGQCCHMEECRQQGDLVHSMALYVQPRHRMPCGSEPTEPRPDGLGQLLKARFPRVSHSFLQLNLRVQTVRYGANYGGFFIASERKYPFDI